MMLNFSRIRVSTDGLAEATRLDQEDYVDHNVADTPDIHLHHTGLRQAEVQKLVPHHLLHVHRVDRLAQLPRSLDDHNHWLLPVDHLPFRYLQTVKLSSFFCLQVTR